MDEQDELVTIAWIAKRMGIARPSVTKIMRAMGVPRYEFTSKCVRYPKSAVEAAIAASYRLASARNE